MTPEELMKPRYKVIADYPKCPFTIGDILIQDMDTVGEIFVQEEEINNKYLDRNWIDSDSVEKYPAIFRKLDWWEDRKPEDMPKYVKWVRSDTTTAVLLVLDPVCNRREFGHEANTIEHRFIYPSAVGYFPATEEEYNAYTKTQ